MTLKLGEQIFAVLLIEMHDELVVAMGAEHVTLGLELRLPLRVVEQLAIADDGNAAVLVEEGLPPVLKTENAEPPMREAEPRCEQGTGIVGAAMEERRAHARDLSPIGLPSTLEVDHSCQAAHFASLENSPGLQ